MAVLTLMLLALFYAIAGRFALAGRLLEFSSSQRQMYGKYAGNDRLHGITFFSGPDDYLLVRSFDGANIIETSPFSEIDGKRLRSVRIMGNRYTQRTRSAQQPSDIPVDHDMPVNHTLQRLLSMREISLLEGAARAVGERGITGKNTPTAMPFFIFALRATQLHARSASTGDAILTPRHKRQSCFNTCPPCPDDECYGMCGYSCSCWSFVCGDCCYHQGCHDHDTCCRQEYFQIRCLVPTGFSCDEQYSC